MGVDQPDPANRGPAYMSQHRGGLDPRGGRTIVTVVRRRRPALDAHIVAIIGGDAPTIGVLEAAEIAPALDEQRVGRLHQVPVDLVGRASRAGHSSDTRTSRWLGCGGPSRSPRP